MRLAHLSDRLGAVVLVLAVALVRLGGVGSWTAAVVAFACAAWVARHPERRPPEHRTWTWVLAFGLALSVARGLWIDDLLDAGVDYLVLLAAQRLLAGTTVRLRLQLAALSFLLVVAAAVVHTGLSYPPLAAAYVVAAVADLMLLQIRREAETLGRRIAFEVDRDAPKIVRPVARAAALAALAAFAGALFVFLFFPRFGPGVFLHGPMAKTARSGFSDAVVLGDFGRIRSDPTPVLRIYLDGQDERAYVDRARGWYLRGTVFDTYRDGRWARRATDPPAHTRISGFMAFGTELAPEVEALASPRGWPRLSPAKIPGFAASTEGLRGRILLDDLGVDTLVAVDRPVALRIRPRSPWEEMRIHLAVGPGETWHAVRPPGSVLYEFVARTGLPTREELSAVGSPAVPPALADYARPPEISPRLAALASRLAAGKSTRLEKVEAAMDHLAGFSYTLEDVTSSVRAPGQDPVDAFVFESQAGHCEYFASALALLLRQMGIPTRVVNGFQGATWNELGGFFVVRQADAHSWVEVHFGPLGWVRFDPTPADARAAAVGDVGTSWWRRLYDAMENAYLTGVIGFDLARQMEILRKVAPRAGSPRRLARRTLEVLAAVVGGLFVLAWGFRRIRTWRRRAEDPLATGVARVDRALARSGRTRPLHRSLGAHAASLAADGDPVAPALSRFAAVHAAVRYGGRPLDGAARTEAAKAAREVVAACRTMHRPSRRAEAPADPLAGGPRTQ
ncbi:MAG: DUF3488 domain-containing protein [Deltaproteobacteria bacterium]|nr:MAG: DUF3488 domain-containing protein [Deltaproteobacteria bacterium]